MSDDGDDLPAPERSDTWTCPRCPWWGRNANIDPDRWEVTCPRCSAVIDDRVARMLEQDETSEWSRDE